MRIVIAFDVSDDRVRYRVVKVLREYACRVQKSVFEAVGMDRAAYLRMRSRLERLVDRDTDSLRYYLLCKTCGAQIESFGVGPGEIEEPRRILIV